MRPIRPHVVLASTPARRLARSDAAAGKAARGGAAGPVAGGPCTRRCLALGRAADGRAARDSRPAGRRGGVRPRGQTAARSGGFTKAPCVVVPERRGSGSALCARPDPGRAGQRGCDLRPVAQTRRVAVGDGGRVALRSFRCGAGRGRVARSHGHAPVAARRRGRGYDGAAPSALSSGGRRLGGADALAGCFGAGRGGGRGVTLADRAVTLSWRGGWRLAGNL